MDTKKFHQNLHQLLKIYLTDRPFTLQNVNFRFLSKPILNKKKRDKSWITECYIRKNPLKVLKRWNRCYERMRIKIWWMTYNSRSNKEIENKRLGNNSAETMRTLFINKIWQRLTWKDTSNIVTNKKRLVLQSKNICRLKAILIFWRWIIWEQKETIWTYFNLDWSS